MLTVRVHNTATGAVAFSGDVDHVSVATFPAKQAVFIEGDGRIDIGISVGARISRHKQTLRIDLDRPPSLWARLRRRFTKADQVTDKRLTDD